MALACAAGLLQVVSAGQIGPTVESIELMSYRVYDANMYGFCPPLKFVLSGAAISGIGIEVSWSGFDYGTVWNGQADDIAVVEYLETNDEDRRIWAEVPSMDLEYDSTRDVLYGFYDPCDSINNVGNADCCDPTPYLRTIYVQKHQLPCEVFHTLRRRGINEREPH